MHTVATVAMAATLAPSLWLGRSATPAPLQLIFLGLLGLSVLMGYRAVQAWRWRPEPGDRGSARFVRAVGFNLVGLVTGFVTVGVLDLGSLAVVAAAVTLPLVGHHLLGRATDVHGSTARDDEPDRAVRLSPRRRPRGRRGRSPSRRHSPAGRRSS